MCIGSGFHRTGAHLEKDLSPYVLRRVVGTRRLRLLPDLRDLGGLYSSIRY